jgi:outer membrane lipoprotein carrier protein
LRFLVALALTALVNVAHASAVDQMRSFLSDTKTARGEFSQKVSAGSKPPVASSGTFEFERPGRFRWTYDKPYEQIIVSDGQKLFVYDRDLNQVTVKKIGAALPASPASILFGTNEFERDFEVRDDGERDGMSWIVARPRARDTQFDAIRIGFRNGVPGAMQIADSFGQTTVLAFKRFERNPKLAAGLFQFVPPKGADVLEDR